MHSKKINPLVSWWVTPKLPYEDVFARHNFVTQWIIHPIKRRIARIYLKFLRKFGDIKVIGITGSAGKTTTTEMLASILKEVGKTVWSKVGVDPVYNIPNTILRANLKTKYLILEMSVEFPGEMDYYLWLSCPDIGIITNIGPTHTKYLGSKEKVAFEKGKLVKSLSESGVAILNVSDESTKKMKENIKANVLYFGNGGSVRAKNICLNDNLSTDFILVFNKNTKNVHLGVFGNQFVDNALAASTAALSLNVSLETIVRGLEKYRNQPHRLNIFKSRKCGIIMDDTYNSNPKAAFESLDTFDTLAKGRKKIVVVGDMLELGQLEVESHKNLGKKIGQIKPDYLVGVGNAVRFTVEEGSLLLGKERCFLTKDYKEALEIIKDKLDINSALFVKGSRSIHLDKLVENLK